jgi:hypothetical protein
MRASADFRSESTALLAVQDAGRGYAVPGACVLTIEHLRDWQGEPPLDVAALFGFPQTHAPDEAARVAVLDTGMERVPLLVRGSLTVLEPGPDDILALPLSMHSTAGLVSHVALVAGIPTLLVLSPARLARVRGSS